MAPTFDVSGDPYPFYYVTATDFSGNEGGAASLETVTGIGEGPREALDPELQSWLYGYERVASVTAIPVGVARLLALVPATLGTFV